MALQRAWPKTLPSSKLQEGHWVAFPKGMATNQPSLTLERPRRAALEGRPTCWWAGPRPCAGPHGTTPTFYLVALGAEGVIWVARTGLAAPAAGQLPVVGSTLVTFGAHHVGQTQAAPTLLITWHVLPGPQDAAVAACKKEGC